MKNYVMKGDHIAVKAPSDIASGDLVIVGDLHGVAVISGEKNSEITIATSGVFELEKEEQAVAIGETAYWNEASKKTTSDDASGETPNKMIGLFVVDSEAKEGKAQVKLA